MSKTVRIHMTGRISGHTATTLGGRIEERTDGSVLVAPYVDQAQLTGLLLRLADLHLTFDQVAVEPVTGSTRPAAAATTTTHARSNPMTTSTANPIDTDLAVARTKRIGVAALATTTIAAVAGLCLLALDPTAGSSTEAILGVVAAVGGLLTAALVVGAVVYAQAKGLWSRLPVNWRYVVWALLAIGIARTIWSQVSNLS